MNEKLNYLITSAGKAIKGIGKECPNCGKSNADSVDRKYFVTSLVRCQGCHLLYRTPTTSEAENAEFYQAAYTQGFTTELPSDAELQGYIQNGFGNDGNDYSTYIQILEAVTSSSQRKLFDFGCSWGYGSYQFCQAGFDVEAYEISKPRGKYASDKLNIPVHHDPSKVQNKFDVFFSAHVLEHVPQVKHAIDFAFRILKKGGLFVSITPNGSQKFREAQPGVWHKLWGQVHPNFLDDKFYQHTFMDSPYFISSSPYPFYEIEKWRKGGGQVVNETASADELLIVVRN